MGQLGFLRDCMPWHAIRSRSYRVGGDWGSVSNGPKPANTRSVYQVSPGEGFTLKLLKKSSCIRVVRSVIYVLAFDATGQVAQSVEQGIENPRVGGSSPSLTTIRIRKPLERAAFSSAKWACSSVGQSARLIIVRSQVRTLSGPPPNIEARPSGRAFFRIWRRSSGRFWQEMPLGGLIALLFCGGLRSLFWQHAVDLVL